MSAPKLSAEAIQSKLKELNNWRHEGDALTQRFQFSNFVEAFGWMTSAALVAESMDHHPDWKNVYNRVDVALSTHDSGGVTEKDFKLAHAMDALARSRVLSAPKG